MVISEYCDIFHKDKMGVRRLAYEVKHEKEGFYYLINFKTQNENNITFYIFYFLY